MWKSLKVVISNSTEVKIEKKICNTFHFIEISKYMSNSFFFLAAKSLTDGKEEVFKHDDVEIFKYVKWGSTVHVYSFMRVWISTDNVFVQVLPAPSTRGQHCGKYCCQALIMIDTKMLFWLPLMIRRHTFNHFLKFVFVNQNLWKEKDW